MARWNGMLFPPVIDTYWEHTGGALNIERISKMSALLSDKAGRKQESGPPFSSLLYEIEDSW